MKIIQLLVTLQQGDAIGNFTIALHEMLLEERYDAKVYAYNLGSNIDGSIAKNIKHLKETTDDDLIIYQMCEGHKINDLIRKLRGKKIAIYHNATPPEFFTDYGVQFRQGQKNALKVIASMKTEFVKCVADSEYNKQDLISMGYPQEDIIVIPITIDYEDYKKEPDKAIREKYNDDFVNILFVGRIAPNKKQEDIVRIFAYYHEFINCDSRLFLIGSPFIADYNMAIKDYISYLNLEESIVMPGHSTFEEILAYYTCADVFLCMSEHEGFCVPLIEAMQFDVPVIAYNSTAIPYTLGEAGVLVEDKEPETVSRLIEQIIYDDSYTDTIINKQRSRLKAFDSKESQKKYLKVIKEVLGESK